MRHLIIVDKNGHKQPFLHHQCTKLAKTAAGIGADNAVGGISYFLKFRRLHPHPGPIVPLTGPDAIPQHHRP